MQSTALDQIKTILSELPDPEIPVITLQELGVIRDVHQFQDEYVVTITPTYSGCPAMGYIQDQIKDVLTQNGFNKVSVELSYTPAWTSRWMNKAAMQKLKAYGIAPPQHCCGNEVCASSKCAKIECPHCSSRNTYVISEFGSTACKALYKCNDCLEPFEYFKNLD